MVEKRINSGTSHSVIRYKIPFLIYKKFVWIGNVTNLAVDGFKCDKIFKFIDEFIKYYNDSSDTKYPN